MKTEEARELAVELLLDVKDILSQINKIVVDHNLIPKNPTHTLDLSCLLDEIVAEIQDSEELEEREKQNNETYV